VKLLLFIEIFIVFLLSLINLATFATGGHWAPLTLLPSDGSYIVLSTLSHHFGLGLPYKDYWELRPPGFLLLIELWVKIFGFRISAFKLLELTFRFGIGLEIYLIVRKIFPRFQSFLVATLTNLVFFSPAFGTMMYADPYGLFFSLSGLLILLSLKPLNWRFFLAVSFFVLSGQIKDPFNGSLLAVIPFLVLYLINHNYRYFFKAIFFSFLGALTIFIPLVIYLTRLNVLNAYLEVLNYKADHYQLFFWQNPVVFVKGVLWAFWFPGKFLTVYNPLIVSLFLLFFLLLVLIFKRNSVMRLISYTKGKVVVNFPSFKLLIRREYLNAIIVLFFSIGLYFGFYFNNGFSPHYLIIILVPFYFTWSIIILLLSGFINSQLKFISKKIIFSLLLIIFLFPPQWIRIQYKHNLQSPIETVKLAYRNLISPDAKISDFESYISSKISKNDCILSVYGWKSSETFLYTRRKPCSRFVVPNMIYLPWQREEYRLDLIKNPPQAIVDSGIEDIDIAYFEKEVLNLSKVLKECYTLDTTFTDNGRYPTKLYFPKSSREKLKACFQENIL